MMTFRRGRLGSAAGGQAMASYLLAGTLKSDTAKAAAYYLGQEATHQRARSFWDAEIGRGQELAGQTVAELRPDLSVAFANRLGLDPEKPLAPGRCCESAKYNPGGRQRIQGRQR